MTYRQRFLKLVYPAWMWWLNMRGKNTKVLSNEKKEPPVSFYSLQGNLIDGTSLDFSTLKGKKILLVNTASDCGYTDQYDDLQKLYQKFQDQLLIIAFPANDFKEQEKDDDATIAAFCKKNYGVSFPLMKKSMVIKGEGQNPVFKWLTDPSMNGWNDKQPAWNFCKYLVNEKGMLVNYFGSSIQPLSYPLVTALKK